LCFGYYAFAFTAIRQSVAIGFTVMAYFALENKQLLKFFVYCILAVSFHMSAIVFVPVCLFGLIKINRLTICLIASAGILLFLARNTILNLYASSYADKGYEVATVGGQRFLLVLVAMVILGWIFRKNFLVNRANRLLFLMSFSAAVVFAISRANPFFLRTALYFQVYQVCYIPNLVRSIQSAKIRLVGYVGFIAVGFYYFFTQICFSYALSPYRFFWQ
ncbi:MAG: EpsG family protein, partial [Ruthenibacterium sp.]